MTPSQREGKVTFMTDMANVTMTISVSASPDVTKLVLDYDLLIVPMFFEYQRHARLEMPLDKVDRDAVGKWVDDQLVACVKAYLMMQENQYYIQRAMVEDPITKARFLPQDAAGKLEHGGHTQYFASNESFEQYKKKHQIA
jgi:YHS domain-containing protein